MSDTEMSPGNKNTNSDFEDQGIKSFEDYDMNPSNLRRKKFPKMIKSSRQSSLTIEVADD